MRLSATEGEKEVGRIWVYVLQNDLHKEPWAHLEDLFVDAAHRNKGLGSKLLTAAV